MKAPVSVIIPCYCCAGTISRAINSVIFQTQQPKEILLIDDFSNDNGKTLKAIAEIQSTDTDIEIKVIQLKNNSGPGTARNEGWAVATQTYIAFLDADDSWHSKKLEVQLQWMIDHPEVAMTGHLSTRFSSEITVPEDLRCQRVNKYCLLLKNYFPTRSVMLKRDIPIRFSPKKRYAEDYLLWLSIIMSGSTAYFLKIPMAFSYKEEFGEDGLTADLLQAQYGVIDTYKKLQQSNYITLFVFLFVSGFSWIKYYRRWVITKLRAIQ